MRRKFQGIDLPVQMKNPLSGARRSTGLFAETCRMNETPIFSLDPNSRYTEPCLKDLYMEISDVTEYKFAMQVFGSWDNFQHVLKSKAGKWIKLYNEELRMMLQSKAVLALIKASEEEGTKGVQAMKYIAEHQWDKPLTKAKVNKIKDEFQDDADRIGLQLIKSEKTS